MSDHIPNSGNTPTQDEVDDDILNKLLDLHDDYGVGVLSQQVHDVAGTSANFTASTSAPSQSSSSAEQPSGFFDPGYDPANPSLYPQSYHASPIGNSNGSRTETTPKPSSYDDHSTRSRTSWNDADRTRSTYSSRSYGAPPSRSTKDSRTSSPAAKGNESDSARRHNSSSYQPWKSRGKNFNLLKASCGPTERKTCSPVKPKAPTKQQEDKGKQVSFSPSARVRFGGINATPPRTKSGDSTSSSPRAKAGTSSISSARNLGDLLRIRRLSTSKEVLFPIHGDPADKCGPSFDDDKLSDDSHAKVRLVIATDFEVLHNHHARQVRQEVRIESKGGCTDATAYVCMDVQHFCRWKCKA